MEEFRQAIVSLSQCSQKRREADGSLLLLDSTTEDQQAFATLSSLSHNEDLLLSLFHGIDFNNTGYIDYSEFLAACLARKEGLKREYAELIFELWGSDRSET